MTPRPIKFLDADPFRPKVNNLTGQMSDISMRGIDAPYSAAASGVGKLASIEISNLTNSTSFTGGTLPPAPGGSRLHVLGIQGGALRWVSTKNC